MRFSLRFFHARLQASAANRTIPVIPLGGTYANVQTLPPFRLNWVCLLTLWTVGFLEWFFPSAIRQEVYTFDAACRRSLHDWCFQLYNILQRSACQHVACTQQPLWICRNESAPLTGGLHGPNAHLPLPPPHLGRKNSICLARWCFCFSIQDELWGLSWPAASHQPGAKKTKKVCRIWSLVFSQNDHP